MAVTDQMGVLELIAHWRYQASRVTRDLVKAQTQHECADELERAYHNDNHDAEFRRGCKHCDAERQSVNMDYPIETAPY